MRVLSARAASKSRNQRTTPSSRCFAVSGRDGLSAWAAGAGLLFRLSRDVALDVGVQYVGNGEVRYLAEGDLVPSPGGAPPVIVPRRTEANLVTVTVGLSFGR